MTRTQARLAKLDRLSRRRPLTQAEADEAYRLNRLRTQCEQRRTRYASDPDFRRKLIERAVSWRRASRLASHEAHT